MYTFGEIKTSVAKLAQRVGDTDYASRIADWVNWAHNKAYLSYDFWEELQAKHTFSATSSQEIVYLPSDFDKPYRLFDFTNNVKMLWTTREEYIDSNVASVADSSTGQARYGMIYGVGAIAYAPSAAFTIKVKSSSSSDNTGIVVRAEGWIDSAKTILGYENITISTSSPTTYTSGAVSFYGITRLTKSADTTGYVTVQDSSSNTLATISPYDRESRYPSLYLGPIPSASTSYQLLYKRKIKKMVDDNDYPFMDCCDYLVLEATGYAFQQEKESETRAQAMFSKANDNLMLLIRNAMNKMGPDFQNKMVPRTLQSHRF